MLKSSPVRPFIPAARSTFAVLSLLGLASLAGCRGCSPDRAPPRTTSPPASTENNENPAPPLPEQPAAPVPEAPAHAEAPPPTAEPVGDGSPSGPAVEAARTALEAARTALEAALLHSQRPVAELIAAVPAEFRDQLRGSAFAYVRCSSARRPEACDRLAGDDRQDCRIEASQIAARSHGAVGWVMVPPMLTICTGAGVPEVDCVRYGQAIETGNAALCEGLPRPMRDCPAIASGDSARCAGAERGCADRVSYLSTLRTGVAGLQARTNLKERAFAVGLESDAACAQLLASFRQAGAPTPVAQ